MSSPSSTSSVPSTKISTTIVVALAALAVVSSSLFPGSIGISVAEAAPVADLDYTQLYRRSPSPGPGGAAGNNGNAAGAPDNANGNGAPGNAGKQVAKKQAGNAQAKGAKGKKGKAKGKKRGKKARGKGKKKGRKANAKAKGKKNRGKGKKKGRKGKKRNNNNNAKKNNNGGGGNNNGNVTETVPGVTATIPDATQTAAPIDGVAPTESVTASLTQVESTASATAVPTNETGAEALLVDDLF